MGAQWEDSPALKNRATWDDERPPPVNKMAGTARSAIEGATLGFREEIENKVAGDIYQGNPPFVNPQARASQFYNTAMGIDPTFETQQQLVDPQIQTDVENKYAQEQQRFKAENPVLSTVAEIGGGVATGGLGAAKTATLQGGKRFAALMGLGGGYGAVSGAGYADKGEALEDALTYGLIGAGLGVTIPWAASKVGDTVKRLIAGKKTTKSDRAILKAIMADDQTPEQMKELLRQWPDATLPDVGGKNMTDLARESRAVGGQAANLAENFYIDRMKGEYTRLLNAFKTGIGKEGTDFFKSKKALETSRKEIAGPMYEEAYRTLITVTDNLQDLLSRPAGKSALQAAKRKAANEGITLADDAIDVRTIDYVKRALDDKIGPLMRAGKKDDARILLNLKNGILHEVDPQVPAFRDARQIWSGSAELDTALDEGVKFLRGDSDMVAREIAELSDVEREFFRLGAIRAIKNKIGKTRDTNSIAMKMQDPNLRERLEAVFPDREAYDAIIDMIEKEVRFGTVRNEVLTGSQTYEKFLANQGVSDFGDAAIDLVQGRPTGLVRAMLNMGKDKVSRPSQAVADDTIQKLTQNNLVNNLDYLTNLQRNQVRIDPRYRQLSDAMALGGANVGAQYVTKR